MTVREFRELLSRFPDDAQVVVGCDGSHRILSEDDLGSELWKEICLFDVDEIIAVGRPVPEGVDLPWMAGCPGFLAISTWW